MGNVALTPEPEVKYLGMHPNRMRIKSLGRPQRASGRRDKTKNLWYLLGLELWLGPTFAGRVLRGQRNVPPRPVNHGFPTSEPLQFHEAEWAPFQTQNFSGNLVKPGIELEPVGL
jgi:hypothetical protein